MLLLLLLINAWIFSCRFDDRKSWKEKNAVVVVSSRCKGLETTASNNDEDDSAAAVVVVAPRRLEAII